MVMSGILFNIITSTVLPPEITISPIQGAMVGNSLTIECMVGTDDGVESSSVMISWMGPDGDTITNTSDSRVTISPATLNNTDYLSTLTFMYLKESDEGNYTCNGTILDTNEVASVMLEMLTSKISLLLCIK